MKRISLGIMLTLAVFCQLILSGCSGAARDARKDGLKAALITAKDIRTAKNYINEYRKEMSTKNFDKAEENLKKAQEANPVDVDVYLEKADFYMNRDEKDKAIAVFDEALKLDPEDVRILERKGAIYFRMKNYQEALSAIQQAIKINPSDDRLYYAMSTCYRSMNQMDKADEVFEEALKNNPNDRRFKDLYIRHLKARSFKAKGQEKVELNKKLIDMVDQMLKENDKETTLYAKIYYRYMKVNALHQIWKATSKDEDKKAAVDEARKFIDEYKNERFGRRELQRSADKIKEMTGEEIKLPEMKMPGGRRTGPGGMIRPGRPGMPAGGMKMKRPGMPVSVPPVKPVPVAAPENKTKKTP